MLSLSALGAFKLLTYTSILGLFSKVADWYSSFCKSAQLNI